MAVQHFHIVRGSLSSKISMEQPQIGLHSVSKCLPIRDDVDEQFR